MRIERETEGKLGLNSKKGSEAASAASFGVGDYIKNHP